jgi:branched-chain amino acid transport system substrate-binding protein
LTELGGKAVEGTFYSTHYSPENAAPEVKAFVQRYKARWDNETPEAVAALAYDAVMLYADAMRRAGSIAGPKVRDALAATTKFPGITGSMTIDAQRNSAKPAVVVTIKNGTVKFVAAVEP